MEDIVAKYSSQLADLKMNSKPLINLLTMMAEDYIRHAPAIVQVIEKHLAMVRPEIKLPVLYLIDSIIKNVKKEYVNLFTQNIVSTFCGVFEKVDEKTRSLLWKLRGTWTDHFPAKKLYAIDLRCHEIDQKWPIQAPPSASGSIHVNPRFLKGKAQALLNPEQNVTQAPVIVPPAPATAPAMDSSTSEVQMRAQLLAKQKELLELQTRKVELELLQTKLQMEEKARRHKEEETSKQIDIAVKQERMLLGMAETAKSRTELIQQQLSQAIHPKPSSSSVKSSPSSKSQDSSSDRESHTSSSSKLAKSHSEASGSSVDGSPTKKSKSSSRDKEKDRDRRDRSKSDKSSRDRHESKDKESRHTRHRDKDRHGESSKDKEKSRSRERSSRDGPSASKSSGDWKDYNDAKKATPPKRSYRKGSGLESEDENTDIVHEMKPLQRNSSPNINNTSPRSTGIADMKMEIEVDSHLLLPSKSPTSNSQTGDGSLSPGHSSPLKRKLPKDKPMDKERSKEKESKSEKSNKEKEKPVAISDPRLRRRLEREKGVKSGIDEQREHREQNSRDMPCKPNEWKDYRERQQAVLRKSYRKNAGDGKDDDATPTDSSINTASSIKSEVIPGDVDLRFEAPFDVDLRTESDSSGGPEPPAKKQRAGSHGAFDEYYAF